MTTDQRPQPQPPTCPRCGGAEVLTVEQAQSGKGALTKNLGTRLAKGPENSGSGDGCMHFAEGLVLSLMFGGGLAYTGVEKDNQLYTIGGVVLGLLILAVTIAVVRNDGRDKDAETSGEMLANEYWLPAHYCYGCEGVFCPDGTPWQGVLTTEQFKKLVWRQGRYDRQLQPGDKAKDAEIPPGTLTGG
ncbi:hypothetical protein GCM10010277_83210 [Streptomyces longisporoflavus]|uniref:hypothetical protein n=1 Tax=Streptomyces longisporoflavus TaxID=28044 RepID=UPI00198CC0C3|nr:hypothetical protein [Streptomyces longisporoflavus]GGV71365.1 hypothetical protein GCM10010277_83210 [Streptomyces longisporoflavus]